MLARFIAPAGLELPALELAEAPRVGDTLALDGGQPWRVLRVHWTISSQGPTGLDLHVCRADYGA